MDRIEEVKVLNHLSLACYGDDLFDMSSIPHSLVIPPQSGGAASIVGNRVIKDGHAQFYVMNVVEWK